MHSLHMRVCLCLSINIARRNFVELKTLNVSFMPEINQNSYTFSFFKHSTYQLRLCKSSEVIVSLKCLLITRKDKESLNALLNEVDWKGLQVGNKWNIL